MDMMTKVQILDKADCISDSTYTNGKVMSYILFW